MLKISSRENQRVKQARKVRDSLIEDKIFVEGLRLAEEILRSDLKISDVFFTESFSQTERGQALLQKVEIFNPNEVSEKVFDSLSDTKNSQGIVIICKKPVTGRAAIEAALQINLREFPLVVLLHQINNPANQGAILRTCEAVGVTGVILTENSAAVFSPKALRGAMGAAFRLPIWSNADFFEVLSWAKEKNLTSVCADVNAKKSYLEIDWKKPRLLVFGSEAHGLSVKERDAIDESLIIPMQNQVESLNLAVSSGVILFEAKRQRR
jgi:TrmH family RNA methyltransferase